MSNPQETWNRLRAGADGLHTPNDTDMDRPVAAVLRCADAKMAGAGVFGQPAGSLVDLSSWGLTVDTSVLAGVDFAVGVQAGDIAHHHRSCRGVLFHQQDARGTSTPRLQTDRSRSRPQIGNGDVVPPASGGAQSRFHAGEQRFAHSVRGWSGSSRGDLHTTTAGPPSDDPRHDFSRNSACSASHRVIASRNAG